MTDQVSSFGVPVDSEMAFRDDGAGRRYASGIVVPWDVRMQNVKTGEWEQFVRGAFDGFFAEKSIEDIDVYFRMYHRDHPESLIIGRGIATRNTEEGQWVEFRMATDRDSLAVWQKLNDRTLRRLSIEFGNLAPQNSKLGGDPHKPQGLVTEAALFGTAVVERAFYPNAEITATRDVGTTDQNGATLPVNKKRSVRAFRSWSQSQRMRYLP